MANDLVDNALLMAKMATLNNEVQHRAIEMASMAYSTEKLAYFCNLSYGLLSLLSAIGLQIQYGRILTTEEWSNVQQCYNGIVFCNEQILECQQSLSFDAASMIYEAIKQQYIAK